VSPAAASSDTRAALDDENAELAADPAEIP
jgi:hypothetical protein